MDIESLYEAFYQHINSNADSAYHYASSILTHARTDTSSVEKAKAHYVMGI